MTTTKTAFAEIKLAMAKAFFACAYADQAEEAGQPLRGEIMDQLPEAIDPAATHAADALVISLLSGFEFAEPGLNDSQKMACLYMRAVNLQHENPSNSDRTCTPDLFGHYCAMQAMGTGVGLESFGSAVHDAIPVPYVEFGSHSLSQDYFTDEQEVGPIEGHTDRYTFDADSVCYEGEEDDGPQFWFYHELANPTAEAIADLIRARGAK